MNTNRENCRVAPPDVAALYAHACATDSAAGYYNRNVGLTAIDGSSVNVRIPIPDADQMDHRQWPEPAILTAITQYVSAAPRLLWESTGPVFQIQEWIDGAVLNDIAPRGHPVPGHVPADVAQLFGALRKVPRSALPACPGRLDDDVHSFARRLWSTTRNSWAAHHHEFGDLFQQLGIPADPFEPLDDAWKTLRHRPARLLHCDVHRRNMIIRAGETVFLDWELALFGDPLADVATHLHKMAYTNDEQQQFVAEWIAAEPEAVTADRQEWEQDLQTYLMHEQIKSAVLDAVRYAKVIAERSRSPANEQILVHSLASKIRAAASLWQVPAPDAAHVEATLRGNHGGP